MMRTLINFGKANQVFLFLIGLLFLLTSGCGLQGNMKSRQMDTPSVATLTMQTQTALDAAPFLANLGSNDWNIQHEAVQSMAALGSRAIDLLSAELQNPDPKIRNGAVQALGMIEDPKVVDILIFALNDPDFDVRYIAAQSLGSYKDKKAVEPLINALQNDTESGVRFSAALSLGQIDDKRAVKPLIVALQDENATVRLYSAEALSEIGGTRANRALLKVTDLQTVALIHYFYIKHGGSKYEPLLIQALDQYGSQAMLDDYLNCGNRKLESAARSYADSHGYTIEYYPLY